MENKIQVRKLGKNTLRILMVGGKRCGKTTTLASMWKSINEGKFLGKTGLIFDADDENEKDKMSCKICDIASDYFEEPDIHDFVEINVNTGSNTITYHTFALGCAGTNDTIKLEFVDVPGEWYQDNSAYKMCLEELIKTSDVYIIAVDTPCLVEGWNDISECGKNSVLNRAEDIGQQFKSIGIVDDKKDSKLVLFVPIKCEKYINSGKMDFVVDCLKKNYNTLFEYLQSNSLKDRCGIDIVPIVSLGDIEFFSFNGSSDRPDEVCMYIYKQFLNHSKAIYYNPNYCEQPLLAAMEFLLVKSAKTIGISNKLSIWGRIMELLKSLFVQFSSGASFDIDETFVSELKKLNGKRIQDESLGFITIQDGGRK